MLPATLKTLHLLGAIVWIGGMVFAHFFLRPAAAELPPPQRLPLMAGVLRRFLGAVGVAVLLMLATGAALWHLAARAGGGAFSAPLAWHAMLGLGLVMTAVYGLIRWRWFPRLAAAVAAQDWPAGGAAMALVRRAVAFNLVLGTLIVVAVGLGG